MSFAAMNYSELTSRRRTKVRKRRPADELMELAEVRGQYAPTTS